MTAPNKLYLSAPNDDHEYDDEGGTPYIRADLHQSTLADRDATIARLQARLDAGPSLEKLVEWTIMSHNHQEEMRHEMITHIHHMEAVK